MAETPRKPAAEVHVLACLDRSPLAESILPHAAALARGCKGRLTLLHVLEPDRRAHGAPVDPVGWEIRATEGRRYVEALAALHRDHDLPVDAVTIEGHAAEQISAWESGHDVDFTVLCTHGESGCTEWSLASTARKLLEGISGSVMLVPASSSAASARASYARVMVPLDGSPHAENVLPLAVRISRTHGAELLLVHVVPVPELTRVGPLSPEDLALKAHITERNERVGRDYLEQLRRRFSGTTSIRTVLARDTDVRRELGWIVEREHVDLVVLSAHGGSGRVEEPCGSVAAHLLAHCTTPVLIIREGRHARGRYRDPECEHRSINACMSEPATS